MKTWSNSMQRGEIYFVDFDPVQGREQSGRRSALVVSGQWINSRPLVFLVVPGTNGAQTPRDYPTNVRIPASETGLSYETVFLCFQTRALDPSRFPATPAGRLSNTRMQDIADALRFCMEL